MKTIPIRALIFKDSEQWCAQCIEFDISVQAPTKEELLSELAELLSTYIEISVDGGRKPLAGLTRAPKRFEAMFARSKDARFDHHIRIAEHPSALKIVPTLRYLQPEPA